ncbi:MAG: hypothetical protein ACTSR8_22640 [Promethearchaeota archaeon]
MTDSMIFDPISLLLWGAAITILFLAALLYFNVGRKKEFSNEKVLMYGFSSFFLCIALAWIFWIFCNLYLEGIYIRHTFAADFESGDSNYYIFDKMGTIFNSLGITLFIFSFEYSLKRTRYIFSVINTIFFTLMIMLPYEIARTSVAAIWAILLLLIFILILMFLTKQSKIEFKAIGAFVLFGLLFLLGAIVGNHPMIKQFNALSLVVPPIFCILGVSICILPTLIDPKYIQRAFFFWIMIGISLNIFIWFLFLFFLILGLPFIISIIIFIGNLLISLYFLSIKYLFKLESKSEEESLLPNLFASLSKPRKVTEEEVSISIEKRICLVCKGKVRKFGIFICDCGAFYCVKCVNALIDLENQCWACNASLDESKPVKLAEKEEDVKIDKEDIHKKTTAHKFKK